MAEIDIASIKVGKRTRKDMGDIKGLAASIEALGLIHPIVITKDHQLIVGRRRMEAFRKLKRKMIPATVVKTQVDAMVRILNECDENTCRKDLTPSEGVAMARAIKKLETPAAVKRMAAGGEKSKRGKQGRVNEPTLKQEETLRANDLAARAAGMSRTSFERANAVCAAAEKDPERFADVRDKMDKTGKVTPAFNELRKRQGRSMAGGGTRDRSGQLGLRTQKVKRLLELAEEAKRLVSVHGSMASFIDIRRAVEKLHEAVIDCCSIK